jgi:hypothetical protein
MKCLALLVLPLPFATACASNDAKPTEAQYDATAQAVAHTTVLAGGSVNAMLDVAAIAHGAMPFGFSASANGNIDGSRFGLDYAFWLDCRDANGDTLPACNEGTDTAEASAQWSGSLVLPLFQASIERDGHWSLRGLQSDTATFDGDGTLTFDTTISGSTYHFDEAESYDAVLIDTATEKAIGGGLHLSVDASATEWNQTTRFGVDADVQFSASDATVVLDGTHTYTVDLTTGVVIRVDH